MGKKAKQKKGLDLYAFVLGNDRGPFPLSSDQDDYQFEKKAVDEQVDSFD